MTMDAVVAFIARFAAIAEAPVRTHTTVTSVRPTDDGYRVATRQGEFAAAPGARERRLQPRQCAAAPTGVPSSVESVTPFDYRNPGSSRRRLVVGASATGVQLADEITLRPTR